MTPQARLLTRRMAFGAARPRRRAVWLLAGACCLSVLCGIGWETYSPAGAAPNGFSIAPAVLLLWT